MRLGARVHYERAEVERWIRAHYPDHVAPEALSTVPVADVMDLLHEIRRIVREEVQRALRDQAKS